MQCTPLAAIDSSALDSVTGGDRRAQGAGKLGCLAGAASATWAMRSTGPYMFLGTLLGCGLGMIGGEGAYDLLRGDR